MLTLLKASLGFIILGYAIILGLGLCVIGLIIYGNYTKDKL